MTIPHQSNVLVEEMTENINFVNVSTDDLVINFIYWFYNSIDKKYYITTI